MATVKPTFQMCGRKFLLMYVNTVYNDLHHDSISIYTYLLVDILKCDVACGQYRS